MKCICGGQMKEIQYQQKARAPGDIEYTSFMYECPDCWEMLITPSQALRAMENQKVAIGGSDQCPEFECAICDSHNVIERVEVDTVAGFEFESKLCVCLDCGCEYATLDQIEQMFDSFDKAKQEAREELKECEAVIYKTR